MVHVLLSLVHGKRGYFRIRVRTTVLLCDDDETNTSKTIRFTTGMPRALSVTPNAWCDSYCKKRSQIISTEARRKRMFPKLCLGSGVFRVISVGWFSASKTVSSVFSRVIITAQKVRPRPSKSLFLQKPLFVHTTQYSIPGLGPPRHKAIHRIVTTHQSSNTLSIQLEGHFLP